MRIEFLIYVVVWTEYYIDLTFTVVRVILCIQ